jgi:hypothetical protein
VAIAQPSSVAPLGTSTLVASGGYPPYAFALEPAPGSGPGAHLDAQGVYQAGGLGSTSDTVVVRDSDAGSVRVTLTVGPALALTPAEVQLNPGASLAFTAAGGQPPYRFTLQPGCLADAGGSTLDASGGAATYRAGTACAGQQDQVLVHDHNDAGAGPSVVLIGAGVTLFPDQASVAPGQALTLAASGGVPPYTFAFGYRGNRSGGALTAEGRYQAGPNRTPTRSTSSR